jgi:hypothetical protein
MMTSLTVGLLAMPVAVVPMHEAVHQWARQDQQIGQNAEQMGAVFRQQIEQCHRRKQPPHPSPAAVRVMGMALGCLSRRVVSVYHLGLLQ